jgi:hypothetical protein
MNIPGIAWMDDLLLFATSRQDITLAVNTCKQYIEASGMTISQSKSFYLNCANNTPLLVANNLQIANSFYKSVKYLGFFINLRLDWEETIKEVISKVVGVCTQFRNFALSLLHTARLINSDVISIIQYYLPIIGCYSHRSTLISKLFHLIAETINCKGHTHNSLAYNLMHDKKCGLGITDLNCMWDAEKLNLVVQLLNSKDKVASFTTKASIDKIESITNRDFFNDHFIFRKRISSPQFPDLAHYTCQANHFQVMRNTVIDINKTTIQHAFNIFKPPHLKQHDITLLHTHGVTRLSQVSALFWLPDNYNTSIAEQYIMYGYNGLPNDFLPAPLLPKNQLDDSITPRIYHELELLVREFI